MTGHTCCRPSRDVSRKCLFTAHLNSSRDSYLFPRSLFLRFGNSQKSQIAKSGLYGGCGKSSTPKLLTVSVTNGCWDWCIFMVQQNPRPLKVWALSFTRRQQRRFNDCGIILSCDSSFRWNKVIKDYTLYITKYYGHDFAG